MFCRKCGTNNHDGATFCAACGSPMQQAAPVNALPARKRDIPVVTYVMMILNAVFAFLAAMMLYIPVWWKKQGYYTSSPKKYFSVFSEHIFYLGKKSNAVDKPMDITHVVLIIGFTLVAVAGIVFAILRFRFSAGLLAAAGAFAVAEMSQVFFAWLSETMFYAKYPKYNIANMKSHSFLPLIPIAFCFSIATVVFSVVVFATYRDRSKKEGQV